MNVSKCIRRGLQSVACGHNLQPQLRNRRVVDFSRQLVLHERRSNSVTLASPYGCSSRGTVGNHEPVTNCNVVRVQALSSSSSRIRCASSEAGVAGTRASEKHTWRLIMYSKPGCCLCDGLKEKLSTLPNVELEIRNILTNPAWENAYQYEIPVLAHTREDGTEETIPRLSPRLSAEQIQKKLQTIMG